MVVDVFVYRTEKLCATDRSVCAMIKPVCCVLFSARGIWAVQELFVSTAFGAHVAPFALAYLHGNNVVGVITHLRQITHSTSVCAIPLRISR